MVISRLNVPQATLGECSRWDEKHQLFYWVDIDEHLLWRYDPKSDIATSRNMGESIGCFALRAPGGFVLGLRSGYAVLDTFDGPLRKVSSPVWDVSQVRFNDGRCDPQGRFWAGTMFEPRTQAGGQLYRLDANWQFSVQADPVTISNGIAVSLDQRWLYFADTPAHTVYRYPFDAKTGALGQREVFVTYPTGGGRPDGAVVDSAGNYWVALFNGSCVQCLSSDGKLIQQIDLPTKNPTCLTFGGADLRTLYITTAKIRLTEQELAAQPLAGAVLTIRVDQQGLPEPTFAA
jgi:sugar lactone lactonase YvrE